MAVFDDQALLRAAVGAARDNTGRAVPRPRWAHVMAVFHLGSTRAKELCARFGFDPDEKVRR